MAILRTRNPPLLTATEALAVGQKSGSGACIRVATLLLVYFAIWTVIGRYLGLQHDAQAYAVQALARIQPEIFSGDLFLRFLSQDDFTLFPYVSAAVINLLGLDHAAAFLTFFFFATWMLVCWRLAISLVGPDQAWLSIGLLLVIPGWYGAGLVFRTAEPFLSARPAAEAASLGAILLFIHGQRVIAASLLALSALLHPIMTLPAVLALTCLSLPWQESRRFWLIGTMTIFIGAIAGAALIGGGSAQMSPEWLEVTKARSNYLFPQGWQTADWQVNALPLLSALLSSQLLVGWPKRLARAIFWIAACGLALALFAATTVPLKLLLQGQSWRWIWLTSVFAIMFLPGTFAAAWRHSTMGRVVALLLCTAWLLAHWSSGDQVPPIGVAGALLCCALAAWWTRDRVREPISKLMLIGAASGLSVAMLGLVMSTNAVLKGRFDFGTDPLWVQTTADLLQFVAVPICIVTAAWWILIRREGLAGLVVIGILAVALAVAAAPGAAAAWFADPYSSSGRKTFAEWRDRIPIDAEVFWPDGLQETWFLLNRRSYLSISQLGGIVFSKSLAEEARRRADLLAPVVPTGYWFLDPSATGSTPTRLTRDVLGKICATGGPDFVVDDDDVDLHVAKIEWPIRAKFRFLYDCRKIRLGVPAGRP